MKTVYLDHASTTPIYPEVVEAMAKSMLQDYGNPSSTHEMGRKSKVIVETVRKKIAKQFNAEAAEIVFTSGATEANNFILQNAVKNLGVQRIITTKIEHHAVLNTVLFLKEEFGIELVFLNLNGKGGIELKELEYLLQSSNKKTLVSLMMVNNEIGNLYPMKSIGELCKNCQAFFHSDTVQAISNYEIDVRYFNLDFLVASAHKFHGPKGVGFAYVKKGSNFKPFFYGGEQESSRRGGTENVHAILGMSTALEISCLNRENKFKHLNTIKKHFIDSLNKNFSKIDFNGFSEDLEKSSPTILNVRFDTFSKMLLFQLDINGVMASQGSACQSGAKKKSHVLLEILSESEIDKSSSVRFSFSEKTSKNDIDFCIEKVKSIFNTF